jgi:hypothetical protein
MGFTLDITYNTQDNQLIELFERYAEGLEALVLKTSLDQLKDKTVPGEERQTARQKVESFLYKILPTVGEKVIEALINYVTKSI